MVRGLVKGKPVSPPPRAMGPARQFAKQHGYEVDANRELAAIGAANMGVGLFQGFPIGASLSKSAANDRVGAKAPMSLIVAAASTALVALFSPRCSRISRRRRWGRS
jgi:MFS superfamily sulfate permease-like transporter